MANATSRGTARKSTASTAKSTASGARKTTRKTNMTSNRTRNMNNSDKPGFTIIEVVLVLAIAGLIFMMVFIALPTLQRSQRDTQRRNDMSRVQSQITQYMADNNGKLPDDSKGDDFAKVYLVNGEFSDPQMGPYKVVVKTFNAGDKFPVTDIDGNVYIYKGASCPADSTSTDFVAAKARDYAIFYKLEAGNYCQDSK